MDNVLGSVDLDDLALATLVLSTGHLNLVVLPDGKSSDLTNPNTTQTKARTITHRRVSLSCWSIEGKEAKEEKERTWYFSRRSLARVVDMILRLTDEGASKCALRDFRREEWTSVDEGSKRRWVSLVEERERVVGGSLSGGGQAFEDGG